LKYWEFEPQIKENEKSKHQAQGSDNNSDRTRVNPDSNGGSYSKNSKKSWRFRSIIGMKGKQKEKQQQPPRTLQREESEEKPNTKPVKKMPVCFCPLMPFVFLTLPQVIFFDEAHKLYVCPFCSLSAYSDFLQGQH